MYPPEGRERDEWGFTWFNRQLYIYTLTSKKDVVIPDPPLSGEMRRTGQKIRTTDKWSVIAPDREMADVAFQRKWRKQDPEIVSVEMVLISAEIGAMSSG